MSLHHLPFQYAYHDTGIRSGLSTQLVPLKQRVAAE